MLALETKYGSMAGVSKFDTYADGEPRDCVLVKENKLETPYGILTPQYSEKDMYERQKKDRSSVKFYKNGNNKSIALESQTIIQTPCGDYKAELLNFYEDGSLKRFFPLNGKITGYWTEEDEGALAEEMTLPTKKGRFTGKIMSVLFYPSGEIRSVTLWPGERVVLETPIGSVMIRNGFSLYESGELKSVEPFGHTKVETQIGELMAYDPEAMGIHADANSLVFSETDKVIALTTSLSGVLVTSEMGLTKRYEAREVESYVDETETILLPLKVFFEEDGVILDNGEEEKLDFATNDFLIYRSDLVPKGGGCSSGCASCSSSCGSK